MKKSYLIIAITFVFHFVNSQESECVNNVSTNHINPINNSLPSNSPNPEYGQND